MNGENGFPRDVLIKWKVETALNDLGDEYDPDSENEDSISLLGHEIGTSMETIEIDSWDDIPKGYELAERKDIEDYEDYLERNNPDNY